MVGFSWRDAGRGRSGTHNHKTWTRWKWAADKDAAWLLYVAIQSSKGGCVDPDHTAISKKAWQVLHKQYPRSPWTEQSPYFY